MFSVYQGMYNSCIPIWKSGRTTKCKFSARKVTVFTKGENLQRSFANEHWTEAEPKSDSQVGSLMNFAEFKGNFMDKFIYYHQTWH